MASEVVDLFTELAALPSPPGEERAVADVVIGYLRDLGLSVDEDDAGTRVGSNIGNVYCRLEATDGGNPIFLCAHLDTVPPEGPIEPVIEDGVVRNATGTILGAPYSRAMQVRFHGRAAHSGMYPEEGRSAIAAAARAISDLRLGRVDEETTATVGIIHGGTAGNIIPEWCTLDAEARSHDERKLDELVQEMVDVFSFAAGLEDCEVETKVSKSYKGYRFKPGDRVVRIAAVALEHSGYKPAYGLS